MRSSKASSIAEAQGKGSDGASAAAGSRDMNVIARAGPCSNFEDLKPVYQLLDVVPKIRACTSAAELKDVLAEPAPQKKAMLSLQASCKACVSDLRAAHTRAQNAAAAAAKKEAKRQKEEAERKKAFAAATRSKRPLQAAHVHPIFALEPPGGRVNVKSASSWEATWDLQEPFLVSGFLADTAAQVKCMPPLLEEIGEFKKLFNESSMKVAAATHSNLKTQTARVLNPLLLGGGGFPSIMHS